MQKYFKENSALFSNHEMVRVFAFFLVFECIFIFSMYHFPHTILILYGALFIFVFINLKFVIVLLLITDPLYFIIRNNNVSDAALVAVFREGGIVLIVGMIVADYLIGNTALVKRKQPKEVWALLCLLLVMLFLGVIQTKNFTTYLLGLREHLFPLLFLAVLILINSARRVEYLKIAIYIQLLTIALLEGYNLLFVGSHIFVGNVSNVKDFRELFFTSGYRVFNSMFIANPGVGGMTLAGFGIALIVYNFHRARKLNFFIRIPCVLLGLCLIGIALRTMSYSVILAILLVLFLYIVCNLNKKWVLLIAYVSSGLLFLFAYDKLFVFLTELKLLTEYGRDYFFSPAFRKFSTLDSINLIFGSGMGVRGGQLLSDSSIVGGTVDMMSLEYMYYFGIVGMLLYVFFVVGVFRRACYVLRKDHKVYVFFSLLLVSLFAETHATAFTIRPLTSLLIPLIAIIIYRAKELSGRPQKPVLVPARAIHRPQEGGQNRVSI